MSSDQATAAIPLETFREQLAVVLQSHQRIADVIEQVSRTLPRGTRGELRSVASFFARPRSPEDVFKHPAALSICVPLVAGAHVGEPAREDIESSVHGWIRETAHRRWQTHRRIAAFAYPWVVLALCGVILSLLCIFLVPEFERMFEEFGLMLPAPTAALFGLSHLIIDHGIETLFALVLLVVVLLGVAQWRQISGRASWRSLLNRTFESNRAALAEWARHTASLIQAGVSRRDAVAIAGTLSAKRWLRRGATGWSEELTGPSPTQPIRIGAHRCELVAYALGLPAAASQAAMLREAAAIYRGRDQRRSGWWITWFSFGAICFIGLLIGFIIAALFLPLVSLITGLS